MVKNRTNLLQDCALFFEDFGWEYLNKKGSNVIIKTDKREYYYFISFEKEKP